MSVSRQIRYGLRHFARESWLSERRADWLQSREFVDHQERARTEDQLLAASLQRAAETIPAYAFLRHRVPSRGVAAFLRENVPIVSKSTLLSHRETYYPRRGSPRPWWSVGKTSGTTGTPLDVFRSFDSTLWEHAFHLQHWRWAGLRKGDRQVVLRGDLVVPVAQRSPPYWFHDVAGRQLFVSSRHLNGGTAAQIGAAIAQFGASHLRAYPSTAFELARWTERLALPLRFRAVVTGSEPLYPSQREFISEVFHANVFDTYGMAERNVFAMQCEQGRMHVNSDYSWVEIVDDAGRATDGEGLLVGTTFRNLVMPLVRYQLSDRARWSCESCPCGRSYPVIEALDGRSEDRLYDLAGNVVSPAVITFAFKGVHHIERAQVAQVAQDRWVVRLVPHAAFGDADRKALQSNFGKLVSPRLNVELAVVEELPCLPSGKFKWVVQEWAGSDLATNT